MFATTVEGAPQLINRLRAFEPDIYKALQREIKAATDVIGAAARSMIPAFPLTNWGPWEAGRLDFYGPTVAASIKPRFRTRQVRGTGYVMGVVDTKSAPGNIYALAGSKTDSGSFNEYLNANWGKTFPRALGPAWTIHVDSVRESIQQAVDDAARKVTSG